MILVQAKLNMRKVVQGVSQENENLTAGLLTSRFKRLRIQVTYSVYYPQFEKVLPVPNRFQNDFIKNYKIELIELHGKKLN